MLQSRELCDCSMHPQKYDPLVPHLGYIDRLHDIDDVCTGLSEISIWSWLRRKTWRQESREAAEEGGQKGQKGREEGRKAKEKGLKQS